MTSPSPVFGTKLCDLVGIEYPILQSRMGGVAGPALAAALRTAGRFGVNLLIPPELRPPVPGEQIPDETVREARHFLRSEQD